MHVNVNLMVQNITQIKSGITINVDVSAKIRKNFMCLKNITLGILVYALLKMIILQQNLNKNYSNKFLSKKGNLQNRKFLYFSHLFINYHITVDNF